MINRSAYRFVPVVLTALLAGCATSPGGAMPAEPAAAPYEPAASPSVTTVPAPPYYSVQLASFKTDDKARAVFAMAPGEPFTRAEQRGEWLGIRIGAWDDRAAARQALARYRSAFDDAFVIHQTTQPSYITP